MEQFTFEKDGLTKVCHCHEGVRETLLADGWVEVLKEAPKPKTKTKDKPKKG